MIEPSRTPQKRCPLNVSQYCTKYCAWYDTQYDVPCFGAILIRLSNIHGQLKGEY